MNQPAEIGGPWAYTAYGYTFLSEVKLHRLSLAEPHAAADIHISATWVSEAASTKMPIEAIMRTDTVTASGQPYLCVWVDQGRLRISHHNEAGAVHFTLCDTPPKIEIEIVPNTPAVDVEAYLIGPVFGSMMRFLKQTCLHGAFLEVDGAAIGFVGAKGAGKSTTLAAAAMAGQTVIADDIGVLHPSGDNSWSIPPAYPWLRAWPQTITDLAMPARTVGGPVVSFTEKQYVDLAVPPFSQVDGPRPLRALVVLKEREGKTYDLRRLTGAAGLVPLSAHTYAPHVGAPASRRQDLLTLTQVVTRCRIYSLCLPEGIHALETQIGEILNELASA